MTIAVVMGQIKATTKHQQQKNHILFGAVDTKYIDLPYLFQLSNIFRLANFHSIFYAGTNIPIWNYKIQYIYTVGKMLSIREVL